MHAIVCHSHGDPEVMQFEEVPTPEPGPGELQIRAAAIGVNYVDTMRRSGRHPAAPATPFTPGIELCGTVTAISPEVTKFAVGDRVIGRCITHGAYAEFVIVEERFTVPCPDDLPADVASGLFVNPQTAYHALITMGQLKPGENILITAAAGGVGNCAVQMASQQGARVIAVAGSDEKLQIARDQGADVVVNYKEPDWAKQVLDATDQQGASLILESVGGACFEQCLECWAFGGRIVVFGEASGTPGIITGDRLLFGNRSVVGLAVGTVIEDEHLMRSAMDDILEWYRNGSLKILVGETHPLCDAAKAHRRLEERKTHGKIVLIP